MVSEVEPSLAFRAKPMSQRFFGKLRMTELVFLNLELGISLELGAWNLELLDDVPARVRP
jgi:hypothetical protein